MIEYGESAFSDTEWWRQDKAALATALAEREEAIRRLQAEQGAILAEMQSRGTMAEYGYPTLDALQIDLLRISRQEANRRTTRALACHDIRGIGSIVMPAAAPATAAAFAEGAIGTEHVDTILKTVNDIPADVPADEIADYERTLVELARDAEPRHVRKAGAAILARLDQDGTPPDDEEKARPKRELRWGWRRDGRLAFSGEFDTETGQQFLAALSPLSKPQPAKDGERDTRTTTERNGDALADLIGLTLTTGELPVQGGERPNVVVTLSYDALKAALEQHGQAMLGDLPITAQQARYWACDAGVIPAVLGSQGEILDLGRKERLVTLGQRRALELRDKGCIKCGRPAKWCHAHHIISWLDLGPTDLDNLCLLCTACHRLIHHSEWRIEMSPNGIPLCIPPSWMARAGPRAA
ncbi:HNH endonuclease signature motif containing protein [Haloechinothrix salitolerans]|uniref:DUF222 domain-containing protein n=1 Tax=Haloechinothrix salitolerans TaxID=926830 RepID=A0ABW2BWN4_9PSEU